MDSGCTRISHSILLTRPFLAVSYGYFGVGKSNRNFSDGNGTRDGTQNVFGYLFFEAGNGLKLSSL